MRQNINGQMYDIPTNPDGSIDINTVKKVAQIPPNRAMILKHPGGSNEIINPGEKFFVDPEQDFSDAPLHKRGL